MENRINLNLDPNQYAKKVKEAEEYEKRERRYDEPITHELDEYMENLSVDQKLKSNKLDKKEPYGIIVDFMKITNHTIEDITKSLNKSANELIKDMKYSLLNTKHRVADEKNYTFKPVETKIEAQKIEAQKIEVVKSKEVTKQEIIKQEAKNIDMKKELDKARKTDKELYKDLESIKRITDREMKRLNNTYDSYNNLVNMANECNLGLGYEQRMSGIKVYGESKRSIGANQAELVSIVKGETKDQKAFKSAEKAMNYIENVEKKIERLKGQNKFLDIKGNLERNQIIKDISKEIDSQKQILKDNNINDKEEFNKLKDEVSKQEDSIRKIIQSENIRYKEELKALMQEEKLLKQNELKSEKQIEANVKELQNTKIKKAELER